MGGGQLPGTTNAGGDYQLAPEQEPWGGGEMIKVGGGHQISAAMQVNATHIARETRGGQRASRDCCTNGRPRNSRCPSPPCCLSRTLGRQASALGGPCKCRSRAAHRQTTHLLRCFNNGSLVVVDFLVRNQIKKTGVHKSKLRLDDALTHPGVTENYQLT